MSGKYGPLSGLVERCVQVTQKAYIIVYGGDGAGKTIGAINLAKGITSKSGGDIVLVNSGEGAGENWYSSVADFDRIALSDPDVVQRCREVGLGKWGGDFPLTLNNAGDVDPRVALRAFKIIEQSISPDSVIIVDGLANLWTSVRERVDAVGGNRAWGIVQPAYDALWAAFKHRRCHVILTCAAKIQAEMIGQGKKRRSLHVPTEPEMRKRDWHKPDVRLYVRKGDWLAWSEGRCWNLNNGPMRQLTPQLGADIFDELQAPEPEKTPLDELRERVKAAPIPYRMMVAVHPDLANASTWTEEQIAAFGCVLDRLEDDEETLEAELNARWADAYADDVEPRVGELEEGGYSHPLIRKMIMALMLCDCEAGE